MDKRGNCTEIVFLANNLNEDDSAEIRKHLANLHFQVLQSDKYDATFINKLGAESTEFIHFSLSLGMMGSNTGVRGEKVMKQSKEEFIKSEGADFRKTYVDCVLQHVFDFQRNYLLKDMFQVHKAHIVMLTEENLMKKEEAKFILHALKRLRKFQKSNCSIQSSMKISF